MVRLTIVLVGLLLFVPAAAEEPDFQLHDFDGIDIARYRTETLGRMLGMLSHLGLLRVPAADEFDRPKSTGGAS